MAEQAIKSKQGNQPLALLAVAAGWFVPGLGHVILRRWGRALAYFLAVSMLAVVGMLLRGNVFVPAPGDAFSMLGFLADLGSGMFYFLAPHINPAGSDVAHAAGDYGTRLIATAGVLNLLCVLEAYQIGVGQKDETRGLA